MSSAKRPTPERAKRMRQALKLREAGATYAEIGDALGVSVMQAHRDVQGALKLTLQDDADRLRKLEANRLDRMQRALWSDAVKGDQKAVGQILKVMERRARLFGLDQASGAEDRTGNVVALIDTLIKQ